MKRKHRRLALLGAGLIGLGAAAGLVLNAMGDSLVFFVPPAQLSAEDYAGTRQLRIGGLVETGSFRQDGGNGVKLFAVTDLETAVPVRYQGLLPDLFREGQGVVVEGRFGEGGVFMADKVLARHDERYMPPEVVEALKASGQWQDNAPPGSNP